MMTRRGFLAGLLGAAACAPVGRTGNPWDYPTDKAGNVWPEACRRDLSAETAYVPMARVPREVIGGANGKTFFFGTPGDEVINIADDLIPGSYAYLDTLQHERTHVVCGIGWHS